LAASWRAFRAFTLSLLLCAGFSGYASAQQQKLTYDVYAGGFHAVRANVDMDLSQKGKYMLFLEAHTRGLLGSLAPWKGTFESHGWKTGPNEYAPELHKSVTTWRDEDQIKEYKYTKSGGFKELIVTDHGKEPAKREIEEELTKGTTDALTAALHVFDEVGRGNSCDSSMDVFDGKRRFAQSFKHVEDVELESSRYNVYEGPAEECIVEVTPNGGKWHDKPRGWMSIQEQGRAKGTLPTVWLASVVEGAPAVPVKIRVKTDYGTLFMHLVEYKNGDEILLAEERADLDED